MSHLQRLIFQDILPDDVIDKLANISDLDDDDEYMEDSKGNSIQANGKQKPKRGQDRMSESSKTPQRSHSRGSQDEEEEFKNDFSLTSDSESEDEEEDEKRADSQVQSDSEAQSRLSRTPQTSGKKGKRGKVQFSDQLPKGRGAYKGIDLTQLYKAKNEIVYRLTELYLPQTHNQKAKMLEYNREKMETQNDLENEAMRSKKRKIKEEIKLVKAKLKHQVKYCNPQPILDDAYYFYTPGVTRTQLESQRNKYANASHIGRVLPQKRMPISSQQIHDQQKALQQQSLMESKQKFQHELKSYLLEDENGLKKMSLMTDLMKEESTDAEMTQEKTLEQKFFDVTKKINEGDFSLALLTIEERQVVKEYLRGQSKVEVDSRFPRLNMSKVEKQCFGFMKNLNTEDFSYKGQKSAIQSDDNGMFLAELIDEHHQQNQNIHPIFGLTNNSTAEDKLSFHSGDFNFHSQNRQNHSNSNQDQQQVDDYQLQEWIIEQKYKMMEQNMPVKRRKYWGEPKDCSSNKQIQKDNYLFKKFQNQLYDQRGGKDSLIFKVDKINNSSGQHRARNKEVEEIQVEEALKIKDIKEYEYFKNQERKFYEDTDKKINVNAVMRNLKFQLGLITEEEFYAQEELESQMEQQSLKNTPSKSSNNLAKERGVSSFAQRKEQALNDFVDNFDVHFERRKKELHEVLLKKIQQHEKANQQTASGSGQVQTIAYATRVLQISGGNEAKENRLREEQEFGAGQEQHNVNDEEMDEHMGAQGAKQQANQISQHEGMMAEDNMRLRVTKSRANELNHAKCILKLTYTRFDWSEQALLNFHRPDIHRVFEQAQVEAERQMQQQIGANGSASHKIVIGQQNSNISIDLNKNSSNNQAKNVPFINMPMKVMTNEQIEKRAKKLGIINAHEYFKDRFKLSLKDGKFCVFEHIDQQPLFVNNFGMASKLKRYVYADKFLPPSAFLRRSENQGTRHMGPHGVQILKKKGEKIPLLGQIDTKFYKGLTIMENNMYYCPAFYHKPPRNDFFCVMHRDKNQNPQIIVRELSELYVMGQQEPKLEVYNPQSRQYQHFIKRRTQAYVIRFLQENNNYISFQELNKYFPYINDQILKKIIKEINVEVDRNQCCSLSSEYNDEQFRQLVTPENICQYESAQYGEQMLKKLGIRDITNADKISYATNKFCSEETSQKKQLIAKIIEEEVLSTPWNLSQNFLHNKQTRGMMMLGGTGDPSNGHGGYSYLKLPLKISQDSLNKAKINRMYLNPAIQNPKAVTGTDADLRKLSKKEIRNKLIDLGFKEDSISSFTRWEMVALLRDKSSQAVSQGMEGDMKKFARGVRFTSKKQREMYQKQVNDIFKKQISYLSKETSDSLQDNSDSETRDQRQKKINDLQQMNNNYSKNVVEMKEDIVIKNIKEIPNYEILIMANQMAVPQQPNSTGGLNIGSNSGLGTSAQTGFDPNTGLLDKEAAALALFQRLQDGMTLKCTILRKKIKGIKPSGQDVAQIERVVFCSDPKQIKGFNKRKHKHEVKTKRTKKTSLKEKMQTAKAIMEEFKERPRGSETSSAYRINQQMSSQMSKEPVKIKIGGGGLSQMNDSFNQDYRGGQGSGQAISINISQNPSQQAPRSSLAMHPPYQSFQSQMNLSSRNYDQSGFDQSNPMYPPSGQEPGKIAISLFSPQMMQEQPNFNKPTKPKDKDKKKQSSKQQKKQQQLSRFASSNYNDEDYESYKPKTQTSRRRQQSGESLLNEIFTNIIDSCMLFDESKLFHQPVKKREAPSYYDVIKQPIALIDMKNKTKRLEYQSEADFVKDLELLRANAEFYNGPISSIAQLARDMEQHAKQQLKEIENDLKNLEMLVLEQRNQKIKI